MSEYADWDDYRRRVVLPAGWRNTGPGAWMRRNDDGSIAHFYPFNWRDGAETWRHLADAGLGPDGEPIMEERCEDLS